MAHVASLQNLKVVSRAVYATLRSSVTAIYNHHFTDFNRELTDQALKQWAENLLKTVNANVTVHNHGEKKFQRHEGLVIMSNHTSLFDIPICLTALSGMARMISIDYLFKIPIFGRAMNATGMIPINVNDPDQAIQSINQAKQELEKGTNICIYPEGMRTGSHDLAPLKKGGFIMAIESKAKIIPMVMKNAHNIHMPKSNVLQEHQDITVHISDPIDASYFSLDEKEDLMRHVEIVMKGMLKL